MAFCRTELTTRWRWVFLGLLLILQVTRTPGAETETRSNQLARIAARKPLAAVLSVEKWRQVETSVDKALEFLSSRQTADGSFPTIPSGQPGVTSLAVMAYLSRGHQPGLGPNGERINRAIDYVLASQRSDGLFSKEPVGAVWQRYEASHTAIYDHAIAGLMLGEVYGQVTGARTKAIKQAIENGLKFTREEQLRRKAAHDKGGWRYVRQNPAQPNADLSITSWQIMFLRSAKNAEFTVLREQVDEGLDFVRRCFDERSGMFYYALNPGGGFAPSRGMVGAGILSLSLAGQHQTPMAQAAGDWLLANPFRHFGQVIGTWDKFFYSTYYCSQAMAQLGGRYWEGFFPPMVEVLLKAQLPDGSWPPEQADETSGVAVFGNCLSTSLAVLSLTPPYQLLPVYQR